MILITVMVFMALISLLIATLLQQVLLYAQTVNQMIERQQNFYQLEDFANRLIQAPFEMDCIVNYMDPNQIIKLILEGQGCMHKDNKKSYLYILDDLGLFPCLQILHQGNAYASQQWLLTVATSADLIQVRIAKAVPTRACGGPVHLIKQGILSWRYLKPRKLSKIEGG